MNMNNPVAMNSHGISFNPTFRKKFAQTARITPEEPNPSIATETAR
jgi:hypothetical protein